MFKRVSGRLADHRTFKLSAQGDALLHTEAELLHGPLPKESRKLERILYDTADQMWLDAFNEALRQGKFRGQEKDLVNILRQHGLAVAGGTPGENKPIEPCHHNPQR